MTKGSDIEGIKAATGIGFRKHITEYDTEIIAIPIAYPKHNDYFRYETGELTSVCPLSGLPDFYDCTIEMVADKLAPELKTLKFYLMSYRDTGILHEDIAPKILKDIAEVTKPLWIRVKLETKTRGGIRTIVVAQEGDPVLAPR